MIDNSWCFDIESLIFTKVKAEGNKLLKTKFPKIIFTNTDVNKGTPIYPCVYIHQINSSETGNDIEGHTINAIDMTMQIDVVTDTTQSDCRHISSVIGVIFKSLGFQVRSFPFTENGSAYYRYVMRVQRVIGHGDTF